jgi:site-specific DNA-cytosine methylase
VADASIKGLPLTESKSGHTRIFQGTDIWDSFTRGDWWHIEPDVGRVAHGIPARVDRLKGLGNAIVPQIAEWIGQRILEAEALKS